MLKKLVALALTLAVNPTANSCELKKAAPLLWMCTDYNVQNFIQVTVSPA